MNFERIDNILCSVIIINWNSWTVLEECLLALSKQTFRDFDVIVADNGSDSGSIDIKKFEIPDIKIINFVRNYGFAGANNILFNRVRLSRYIVLLNPDALPHPEWLSKLTSAAELSQNHSFFASRLLMARNPKIIDGEGDCYHVSGLSWRNKHGRYINPKSLLETNHEVFSACAAAAMYKTEALLEVGGFDDNYFCYFEDVDLGFRLSLAGYKCLFVHDAIAYHYGSLSSGGKNSDFAVYHGHRNLVWTYVKNMPGFLFFIFLPLHLCLNIFSIFWFTLRGQGNVIIKAKIDAFKGIPFMLKKRQLIQAHRKVAISYILRMMNKSLIPKILD